MKNLTYFKNLDSMRFVAFLFVFISHLGPKFIINKSSDYVFLNFIFQHGRTAVSFFFVLSGFLITYLLIKEKDSNNNINLKAFFLKRVLRIMPLYIIVCLFGFLILPIFFSSFPKENLWYHLFLGANFNQIDLHANHIGSSMILAPLWSIAIEEQFYLVWPFLILIVKPKRYLMLFLLILFSSYLFIFFNRFSYSILILHTFSVLPEFMLGSIIAYLTFKNSKLIHLIKELPKWFIVSTYLVSILIILFLQSPYSYFAYPLVFTFIILEQVFSENSLFKVSSIKGLDYLGKISYGCYMYHSIVLFVVMYFFTQLNLFETSPIISRLGFVILSLSLTIGVSYLSFNTFENYFLTLRKRILQRES